MTTRSDLLAANAALRTDLARPGTRIEFHSTTRIEIRLADQTDTGSVASPALPIVPVRTLKPGARLSKSLAQVLVRLIRQYPTDTDGQLVERFAAPKGVRITRSAVRSRRPRRADD